MPVTTPTNVANLPTTLQDGVTTGELSDTLAIYAWAKGLAAEVNQADADTLQAAKDDATARFALEGHTHTQATIVQEANPQTGSYTLVASDARKMIPVSADAEATITLPAMAGVNIPIHSHVDMLWLGVGAVVIAGAVGVTVRVAEGYTPRIRTRYAAATAYKVAADEWVLFGDLQPAA